MAGSVNKVILIGNLGKDPEVRSTQGGSKICNLTIATSETWSDKASGERKERTEWHRVVIFNERLADVAERFLKKGRKVYIEGAIETRKWTDQSGVEKYSTEVVLRNFRGELVLLDSTKDGDSGDRAPAQPQRQASASRSASWDAPKGGGEDPYSDDIPFGACWQ